MIRHNRTSVWIVMSIWISGELPRFNFERINILEALIGPQCEKLWPFEFLESFRSSMSCVSICESPESDIRVKSDVHLKLSRASGVQFRASRYTMRLNWRFVWKVMTIWISHELPLFNSERLVMWFARIGHPCEKLWPFEFLESFRCLISSVSIYYKPESDLRVKSDDKLNFPSASDI